MCARASTHARMCTCMYLRPHAHAVRGVCCVYVLTALCCIQFCCIGPSVLCCTCDVLHAQACMLCCCNMYCIVRCGIHTHRHTYVHLALQLPLPSVHQLSTRRSQKRNLGIRVFPIFSPNLWSVYTGGRHFTCTSTRHRPLVTEPLNQDRTACSTVGPQASEAAQQPHGPATDATAPARDGRSDSGQMGPTRFGTCACCIPVR